MSNGRQSLSNPRVAVVGATGAVGIEMIRCLEQRNFPLTSLRLFASGRSAGKPLDPFVLAGTLDHYSAAGELYVNDIRTMLHSDELDKLSALTLDPTN